MVPAKTMPPPAMASVAAPARTTHHLVLHFDINETILVGDEAGGDTREDCFNKMLAKSAFVRLPEGASSKIDHESTKTCVPTHWWNGMPLSEQVQEQQPHHDTESGALSPPPPLHTDWEWPTGCCPYYRTKYKKRSKNFVQHHGSIYRGVYEQLRTAFPGKDSKNDDDDLLAHILPAFFHTLRNLPEDCTTTIVLRTFGSELVDIAKAVSEFARGQHPDHTDFRNEALILSEDALVQGRWAAAAVAPGEDTKNNNSRDSNVAGYAGPDYVYQLWNNNHQLVASGDAQVLQFLHAHTICGIQDDYEHWRKNNYEPWAGKPFWIPSDPTYHHVLFDDNIHNLEHDSIASVRRQDASGPLFHMLSGKEIQAQQGHCLIRVPTVAPVLDPNWFLDQIARARERHAGGNAAADLTSFVCKMYLL